MASIKIAKIEEADLPIPEITSNTLPLNKYILKNIQATNLVIQIVEK